MPKRRKTLLLDKGFQLKFSFYVCSWIFAVSLVFPLIIYALFEWLIHYAKTHLAGDSSLFLQSVQSDLLLNLVLLEVSFIGLTFLISLFLSHKIVGPIYKMRKTLQEAKTGALEGNLKFRKGDHFQGMATDYNEMVAALRKRTNESIENVSSAIARIENVASHADQKNKKELDEILVTLRKTRNQISI